MTFDFKKEYKEYYRPKNKPEIINIPSFNFIAVRGKGNPNEEKGMYQQAISILYAVAYILKMSYKTEYKIEGFYEYVVPPLEGFWWQEDVEDIDLFHKETFNWISVIRLPEFVSKKDFNASYAASSSAPSTVTVTVWSFLIPILITAIRRLASITLPSFSRVTLLSKFLTSFTSIPAGLA